MINLLFKKHTAVKVFDECIEKTILNNNKITATTKEKTSSMYESIKSSIPEGLHIKDLSFTVVEQMKAEWETTNTFRYKRPYRPSTINRRLTHIKKVLVYAFNMGYIDKVPVIKSVFAPKKGVDYFTVSDFKKICRALKKELCEFKTGMIQTERQLSMEKLYFTIMILALTGLRPTEFNRLKWSDWDSEKQQLTVLPFSANKSRTRILKVSNECATLLNSSGFRFNDNKWISPHRRRLVDHVVATDRQNAALVSLIKRNQLKLSTERTCIRMLRSSFCTWAITSGMNSQLVCTYLGWSSELQLKNYMNKQAVLDAKQNVKKIKQLKIA